MGGSYEVYELLKDKVVWHDLERDKSDIPSDSFPVIAEGFCFHGVARFGYYGWKREEGNSFICDVKRWAIIPHEIWLAYYNGYFDRFDHEPKFQSEEEFKYFAEKAKHVSSKEIPEDAVRVGYFSKDLPYSFYSASIYYKDNQYYLCDGSKEWVMD